jgi:hypothetical protein
MCHNNEEETATHLFFSCPAAVNRWITLGIVLGGKSKRSPEDLASQTCFWAPFLHGDLYDWCLVNLETKKQCHF